MHKTGIEWEKVDEDPFNRSTRGESLLISMDFFAVICCEMPSSFNFLGQLRFVIENVFRIDSGVEITQGKILLGFVSFFNESQRKKNYKTSHLSSSWH